MSRPKAYEPTEGQKYHILTRLEDKEWEHLDYAKDDTERDYLLSEYRLAMPSHGFHICRLPRKYWPKEVTHK